jgi:acetyl-CoA carboxylase carboxyltransferase component
MNKIKQETLSAYKALLENKGTAYDRLACLFDEGTFVETGRFIKRTTTEFDEAAGNEFEGVVTGYGAVEGRLVFAYAEDYSRMKGAMSEAHAKKIVSVYESALKSGAPVVGILDSVGAKVLEGVGVLAGYGAIMKAAAKASGIIPQIAIVAGNCTGSLATVASLADIVIAAENGKYFVNSPISLKADGMENAGAIMAASESGAISLCAESADAAIKEAKKIICLLPSNNVEGTAYTETADDPGRAIGADVANELLDNTGSVELCAAYGKDVKTVLGTVAGITVGVVAACNTLTPAGANKAAKFVSFCDSFSIPVVTLVDCEGIAVSAEAEKAPLSAALARLAMAYASSTNAKVTVVTGKAYGQVFTLFGSKALGADIAYATENAIISVMPTAAAVEFVYGEQILAAEDPMAEKKAVTEEWNTKIASPVAAARNGDIDDIIATSDVRYRVASALEMLSSKATGEIYKKHGNLPL